MDNAHIGLTTQQAQEILQQKGPNIIPNKTTLAWFSILISQFKSPLIYILLIVSVISLLYGESFDFLLIISVVILNVTMGFSQEFGAHRTFESLKSLVSPKALVIRDGKRIYLDRQTIVPGDLVVLGPGDKIPADGKLTEGIDLLVREAILTGESEAVPKDFHASAHLYMGTDVLSGEGIMEVIGTGKDTELGKIGTGLIKTVDPKTPLQLSLEQLSKKIGLLIIIICICIFLIGIATGREPIEMFRLSVILSIAGIPEGLPITITVILSLAAKRILNRKGLVKQLLSVETLGSTTVLCLDKTGTLTEGIMKVVETELVNPTHVVTATLLSNEQRTEMEVSLWKFLKKAHPKIFESMTDTLARISKVPFTSERKYSISVGKINAETRTFIIGAPELLVTFCDLSRTKKAVLTEQIDKWTSRGNRTLAFASKAGNTSKDKLSGFEWDGLVAIEDPLRKEVHETIIKAGHAGLDVKIITGDHHETARNILDELGLELTEDQVITGKELDTLDRESIKSKLDTIILFARVTPHHKLLLVELLQEQGHVVAMTGDGVNDAQALKRADIGVVMGNSSDLAKEAGDLILLDNDFRVILKSIEQGRLIYANLKKSVAYVLSNSFVEMLLIVGALIVGLPTPLTVAQILWLHLICDGPPDIMLGFEPKEKDLMNIKVTREQIKKRSLLDTMGIELIAGISGIVGFAALLIFSYAFKTTQDVDFARTITFIAVGMVDLIYVFSFKSLRLPVLNFKNLFNNKFMYFALLYGFTLLIGGLYFSPLRTILQLEQISPLFFAVGIWLGIIAILWVELLKYFARRKGDVEI